MAVGRIARSEQYAASLCRLRVRHVLLVVACRASAWQLWLAIASIVHTVAGIGLVRTAANDGFAGELCSGIVRSQFRFLLRSFNIGTPAPDRIDVAARVPSTGRRNIFMARIVAGDQTFSRAYAAVTGITIMTVVHDHCETFLHISFVLRYIFPSAVFPSLEVRPKIRTDAFIAVAPTAMSQSVSGKVGASTGAVIRTF